MIADPQTNTVCISDLLPARHPELVQVLAGILGDQLRQIPGTRDIWCRDYMPIQVAKHRFIQFRYNPAYLRRYPSMCTPNAGRLLGLDELIDSNLVIDGGNVVRWHDAGIMTDRIDTENPDTSSEALHRRLREELGIDRLVIIPQEPEDLFGHADGMLRFVDGQTLLVNDYSHLMPAYGQRLGKVLRKHGFSIIPFPYHPSTEVVDGVPSACGVYINFLQIQGLILVPAFGLPQDEQAVDLLRQLFPQDRIISLPCDSLAREGGVLNCATWNIQA